MSEPAYGTSVLRRQLELVLSGPVRTLLRAHGFTKSGRTFRRSRGPLYDAINFQGSKWNGVTPEHCFFVNIGVGSTEIDAVCTQRPARGTAEKPALGYILDLRWEQLDDALPRDVSLDGSTDMDAFANTLIAQLGVALAVIDRFDSTYALVQWAADHNLLHQMTKTIRYLVSVGDDTTITRYVANLRNRLGRDPRWNRFNGELLELCGPLAQQLVDVGALDAEQDPHPGP